MKKEKKVSAKTNYIFNVLYQIFTVIVPLITTPYISRVLGAEGIGTYSYTYSIVRYFLIIAALGTVSYGAKKISIFQDDRKKTSITFWEVFILKAILTVIMIILYYAYVLYFADNKLISAIQGIYLLGTLLDISWLFQGMEDFKKISIRNFIIKIINIIYIFCIVKTQEDLWKYIFGLAIFTVLGSMVMWWKINRYVDIVDFRKLKPLKHLKPVLELFIPTIATQVYAILDKTMIGLFANNDTENGYYEQAFKVVDMSLMIITTLGTVLMPKVSKEFANNRIENVKLYLKKSYKFVWLLGIPLTLGVIGIIRIFVPVFFGTGYDKVMILLPILSLIYIPMGMNYMTGRQHLVSTNQQNKYTKFLLIGGIINIIVNFILIPKYLSIGAAIGSVVGEICILFISISFLQRTKQYDFKNFFRDVYKYIISGIVMFMILITFQNMISCDWSGLIFLVLIGVTSYGCMLILLKEDITLEILKSLKKKLILKKA